MENTLEKRGKALRILAVRNNFIRASSSINSSNSGGGEWW